MRKIASGTQGIWLATVTRGPHRGDRLACVRKNHITTWPDYHDPFSGMPPQPGYIPAVMGGKVLLVDVKGMSRTYLGIYEIVDIVYDAQGLRFRFDKRLL